MKVGSALVTYIDQRLHELLRARLIAGGWWCLRCDSGDAFDDPDSICPHCCLPPLDERPVHREHWVDPQWPS